MKPDPELMSSVIRILKQQQEHEQQSGKKPASLLEQKRLFAKFLDRLVEMKERRAQANSSESSPPTESDTRASENGTR